MQITDTFNDFFMQDMILTLEHHTNAQDQTDLWNNPATSESLPNYYTRDFLIHIAKIVEREAKFCQQDNKEMSKDIKFLTEALLIGMEMAKMGVDQQVASDLIMQSFLAVAADWCREKNVTYTLAGREFPTDF